MKNKNIYYKNKNQYMRKIRMLVLKFKNWYKLGLITEEEIPKKLKEYWDWFK